MKRTIIYVFCPKRLRIDYLKGMQLPDFPLGWIKIGKTSSEKDAEDKWDAALARIKQEVHTGLNEPCVLVDVFEYPELPGNPDDIIRKLLTSELYEFVGSVHHNKQVDPLKYEIKAGREYLYGVSRRHVQNAIAKFERDLLLSIRDKDREVFLIECIRKNHETSIEDVDETDGLIELYDDIVIDLKLHGIKANHPNNRNYGYISSKNKDIKAYSFSFSVKQNQATIAVETMGEEGMQRIEQFIEDNNIRQEVELSNPLQGVKNKNKYSWKLIEPFDDYNEAVLLEWFVQNIVQIVRIFEDQEVPQLLD